MCMRTTVASRSAHNRAISGSPRRAVTSLTISAPASRAAAATWALEVSTLRRPPAPDSPWMTGTPRLSSSSGETGSAPGRVDSPPTSRISAPASASSRPCATAASGSRYSPPSENESGVTLTTPINLVMRAPLRGIAAGEAGAGARRWAGALALGAFGRRGGRSRLARLLLLVGEDLLRRLAGEQGDELLGIDRLPLQQQLRDPLEILAALAEQALRALVGALDDAADLVIDLAGDLVGVVGLGAELATEEGLTAVVAEDAGAEALG